MNSKIVSKVPANRAEEPQRSRQKRRGQGPISEEAKIRHALNTLAKDGRSALAKRLHEHVGALLAELGPNATHAERMLAERAAWLALRCELDDVLLTRGTIADSKKYAVNAGVLVKILSNLGLTGGRTRKKLTMIDAHAAAVNSAQFEDDDPVQSIAQGRAPNDVEEACAIDCTEGSNEPRE